MDVPNMRIDIYYDDRFVEVEVDSRCTWADELSPNTSWSYSLEGDSTGTGAKANTLYETIRKAIRAWVDGNGRQVIEPRPLKVDGRPA